MGRALGGRARRTAWACGIGVYGTTGRLEKCYRAYGAELESEYPWSRPAWPPKVKDQDFVGKEAHLRHRDEEPAAVLCTLTVDDHTSAAGVKRYPLGREPILTRDGGGPQRPQGPPLVRDQRRRGALARRYILLAYLPPEQATGRASSP